MENTVKYGVKNSVKNGVKSVNFTEESAVKVRRIKDCKQIHEKRRECAIAAGLLLLFLVVAYLQQEKWQVSFLCFWLAMLYGLWHDILNFFLHISERTRKYMCVSVALIVGGIAGIGYVPFGILFLMGVGSIVLSRFAYANDDIYFFQEKEREEKDIRNLVERQERYIDKLEQELQGYERLESNRQEEMYELQQMLESYESELQELKASYYELSENYKAEQGYSESLQESNNRYKKQIEQLEQMVNRQPEVKEDKEKRQQDDIDNISERDLKILNYLDNTDLSYRKIGELLGISYGTVKNVKQKYRPDNVDEEVQSQEGEENELL